MKINGPKVTPEHLRPPKREAGEKTITPPPAGSRSLARTSFPAQDINLIIRQGAGQPPDLSPLQFKLDLATDLPLVTGSLITDTRTPHDVSEQAWAANLRLIIFKHLLKNSWQAGATEITIRTRLEGDFVTLEVSNNGRGIGREDNLDISIYACEIAASHMCGSIELVKGRGPGATFRLTLPVGTDRSLVAGLFSSLYYLAPYGPKQCHDNMVVLAREFEKREFDLHSAKILFLTTSYKGLFAAQTRNGLPCNWTSWHAVLEYEGLILDLDYFRPEAVPVGNYFTYMFATHRLYRTRLETVLVRAIPIRTYIDGLRQGKDHAWYLYHDETYLLQPLSDYLLHTSKA